MLVLQRKVGQGVTITINGVRVRVVVASSHKGKIKLGIEAPQSVKVHRDEVQADVDKGTNREQP